MIAHLVAANYNLCASAKPETAPKHSANDKEVQPKADLVKMLNDALAYCDALYDSQTSTSINEMLKRPGTEQHDARTGAGQHSHQQHRPQQRALRQPRDLHARQGHRAALERRAVVAVRGAGFAPLRT